MLQGHLFLEELSPQHQDQHRRLFQGSLGVIEKTFTTVPTLSQIPVGYMAKYITGTTRRIYFNFDGTLTYFALTNA